MLSFTSIALKLYNLEFLRTTGAGHFQRIAKAGSSAILMCEISTLHRILLTTESGHDHFSMFAAVIQPTNS